MEEISKAVGGENGRRKSACCVHLWRFLCCCPGGKDTGVWIDQIDGDSHNFVAMGRHWCKGTCNSDNGCVNSLRMIVTLVFFLSLIALPISIAAKLSAGDGVGFLGVGSSTPWAIVLLPLWFAMTSWMCIPCSGGAHVFTSDSDSDAGEIACGFGWNSLGCFFLIVFAVVAAILGGKAILIKYAFVPLWILDTLAAIGTIFGCCLVTFSRDGLFPRGGHLRMSENMKGALASVFVGLIFFIGPGIGQAVGSYYWEENNILGFARAVIIPILIIVVLASLSVCAISFLVLNESRKKAFKGLYKSRWWTSDASVVAGMPKGNAATGNALRAALQGSGYDQHIRDAEAQGIAAGRLYRDGMGGAGAGGGDAPVAIPISRPVPMM
jgi:hypothetical protein